MHFVRPDAAPRSVVHSRRAGNYIVVDAAIGDGSSVIDDSKSRGVVKNIASDGDICVRAPQDNLA